MGVVDNILYRIIDLLVFFFLILFIGDSGRSACAGRNLCFRGGGGELAFALVAVAAIAIPQQGLFRGSWRLFVIDWPASSDGSVIAPVGPLGKGSQDPGKKKIFSLTFRKISYNLRRDRLGLRLLPFCPRILSRCLACKTETTA